MGGRLRFSQLMRASFLDPNHDTGLFLYHLHVLRRAGAIQGKDGAYRITEQGLEIAKTLSLLAPPSEERGEGMQSQIVEDIPWESLRIPLPRIDMEPTAGEFLLKKGSVIGIVGPGRVDLVDVLDAPQGGLPATRYPSEKPVLTRKYAMPEGELYAFGLQRLTGTARIGREECVEYTKTFHDSDGILLAKIIQWFTKRRNGIYLRKQVSMDLENDKPVFESNDEILATPLPLRDFPRRDAADGVYLLRIDGREETAIKLVSETQSPPRRWEDYVTDMDLSLGRMYFQTEGDKISEWELAEIYMAEKM